MQLWTLVEPLVAWRHPDRVWRLFAVACMVQAELIRRHPGYQPASVHTVPLAVVDEVKEMLHVLLRPARAPRFPDHGPGPPSGAHPGL
jgi:hypothetical protein